MISEEKNKVIIYTLAHPETGEVRYVGKTVKGLRCRLNGHIRQSKYIGYRNTHRAKWIESLSNKGLTPKIEVLEYCSEENWQECEKYWIMMLRFLGARLTNSSLGGEGEHGQKRSKEAKLKIGNASRGRKRSSESIKKGVATILSLGLKRSERHKSIISEYMKGRKVSDETKAKLSKINTGKIINELQKHTLREQRAINNEKRKRKVDQISLEGIFIKTFNSLSEAGKETLAQAPSIHACCNGKRSTAGGFIWKYHC